MQRSARKRKQGRGARDEEAEGDAAGLKSRADVPLNNYRTLVLAPVVYSPLTANP